MGGLGKWGMVEHTAKYTTKYTTKTNGSHSSKKEDKMHSSEKLGFQYNSFTKNYNGAA